VKNDIKIFYHVLLENHWYSVVREQLDKISKSGILENTSCFYIGLSSPDNIDDKEKNEAIQFFYDHFLNYVYPEDMFYGKKFEVLECKKSEFEYPILEKAIEISKLDKNFIGFYFHTKGISRPDYKKEHSRNAMNVGCIDNWKSHIDKISEGYDMSGINYFEKNEYLIEYKGHYSGNFFFFNPDFFSTVDFSIIDKSNRFYAESIYGIFYSPKFFSLGVEGVSTAFVKTYMNNPTVTFQK
jgi:hypothetical protein